MQVSPSYLRSTPKKSSGFCVLVWEGSGFPNSNVIHQWFTWILGFQVTGSNLLPLRLARFSPEVPQQAPESSEGVEEKLLKPLGLDKIKAGMVDWHSAGCGWVFFVGGGGVIPKSAQDFFQKGLEDKENLTCARKWPLEPHEWFGLQNIGPCLLYSHAFLMENHVNPWLFGLGPLQYIEILLKRSITISWWIVGLLTQPGG